MVLDIGHDWGADLEVGPSGDLAIAAGTMASTQRVLRRLLTNPGDYIWNLGYGAGLSRYVGGTVSSAEIAAEVRTQLLLESAVASSPAPDIAISTPEGPGMGLFELSVRYTDAGSGQSTSLTLPITG